jgi:hypothetical protein
MDILAPLSCQFSSRGYCLLCGKHQAPEVGHHADFGSPYASFAPGDRVELHPCTDRWMMGDRYGRIVKADNDESWRVKLDVSGKTLSFLAVDMRRV